MITIALITHVAIGLVGVGASYATVIALLKKRIPSRFLIGASAVAFLSYVISWFSGGYYYVVRYGSAVKPIIKEGAYPWAHLVVMETKEHVFLFLPILTGIIMLVALFMRTALQEQRPLRRALIAMGVLTFALGVFIALSGVIVSGSVQT
ncbi:MAG: hypothetical protein ACE5F4_02765 [Candidatus Paceibacteria bacterium]